MYLTCEWFGIKHKLEYSKKTLLYYDLEEVLKEVGQEQTKEIEEKELGDDLDVLC